MSPAGSPPMLRWDVSWGHTPCRVPRLCNVVMEELWLTGLPNCVVLPTGCGGRCWQDMCCFSCSSGNSGWCTSVFVSPLPPLQTPFHVSRSDGLTPAQPIPWNFSPQGLSFPLSSPAHSSTAPSIISIPVSCRSQTPQSGAQTLLF